MVISLSHAAAKNVNVPEGTIHVCYCFTPMRYIWDQAKIYFGRATPFLSPLIRKLRIWDRESARKVNYFISISKFISARIRCYYQREATVIYPPVETNWIKPVAEYSPGKAFLYAGALVPYKRVDLLVDVFNKCGHELWIAGRGPELPKLKKKAAANIRFFENVSDQKLAELYADCRALLFPVIEDFGMIPIECLAAGRPVIGMYGGAVKESLNAVKHWNYKNGHFSDLAGEGYCGVFIEKKKNNQAAAILESINFFMKHESSFVPDVCRKRAEIFSPVRFYSAWANFIIKNNILPSSEVSQDSHQEICQHA